MKNKVNTEHSKLYFVKINEQSNYSEYMFGDPCCIHFENKKKKWETMESYLEWWRKKDTHRNSLTVYNRWKKGWVNLSAQLSNCL